MKKYSQFMLSLLSEEIFVKLFGFCANIYLARVLGADAFGLIFIGTTFLMYSVLISDLGSKTLGFIEASKAPNDRQFDLSHILLIKFTHTIFCFIILSIALCFIFNKSSDKLHLSISFYFLLNVFYEALFLEWYYKGLQRFKTIACVRTITMALYVVALLLLVKIPEDNVKVPLIFFVTNMIAVIALFILLPSKSFNFKFSFSFKKYYEIMGTSLPLGIGMFLNQTNVLLPPLIIGKYLKPGESGIYGASLKVILIVLFIDRIFSTIFLSSLPKMWKQNKENAIKNIQTIVNFALVSLFFLSLVLCISSDMLISLLYGNAYKNGSIILSISSWFVALTILNTIFVFALIAIGDKKMYLKAAIRGFGVNVVIITVLIYKFGIRGAALSLVFGELCFLFFCFFEFRKICRIRFYLSFIKTCMATAIAYLPVYYLDLNIALEIALAILIYIIIISIMQVVTFSDLTLVRKKWKDN